MKNNAKSEPAEVSASEPVAEAVFTRQQLTLSKKYANRKDILAALVADGEEITVHELESRMSKYLKGKVN